MFFEQTKRNSRRHKAGKGRFASAVLNRTRQSVDPTFSGVSIKTLFSHFCVHNETELIQSWKRSSAWGDSKVLTSSNYSQKWLAYFKFQHFTLQFFCAANISASLIFFFTWCEETANKCAFMARSVINAQASHLYHTYATWRQISRFKDLFTKTFTELPGFAKDFLWLDSHCCTLRAKKKLFHARLKLDTPQISPAQKVRASGSLWVNAMRSSQIHSIAFRETSLFSSVNL